MNLCKGKCDTVFVLHAEFQLPHHHLLKILSFFPVNILDIFVSYKVTIALLSSIFILNYISLTDESESMKIPSFSLSFKFVIFFGFTWWDSLAEETIHFVYRIQRNQSSVDTKIPPCRLTFIPQDAFQSKRYEKRIRVLNQYQNFLSILVTYQVRCAYWCINITSLMGWLAFW